MPDGVPYSRELGKPLIDWRATLESQGVDLTIPERVTSAPKISPVLKDEKTGMILEDNKVVRRFIARRLSESIKKGENWAAIYSDMDNLKKANTIDRRFGDEAITYGAATVAQAVDSVNFSQNAQIIATRQEHAADETVIWIFGASEEELARLDAGLAKAGEPRVLKEPKFTLSVSSSLITSSTSLIQDDLKSTQSWLMQDDRNVAYNFYQSVVELANQDVARLKIAKDLARLPAEELLTAENLPKFIAVMTENLGDSRISKPLLNTILKLTTLFEGVVRSDNETLKKKFRYILEQFSSPDINVRQASAGQMEEVWKEIFGTTQE